MQTAKLTVVFNNLTFDQSLKTGWGFSCFIQFKDKRILFDTGSDGTVLLSNMEKLKIQPEQFDFIILSHIHGDHTGGLGNLLGKNSNVTIYLPDSFPQAFKEGTARHGASVVSVGGAMQISDCVYSTGEMGSGIKEQALVLKTKEGMLIITGCAHPGIVNMLRHVKEWLKDDIYLVLGGFHLKGYGEQELKVIMKELKKLGVKKIAPSHCTGDGAMGQFRGAWGKDFLNAGCGAGISCGI
jgi:7,8-dihydropterin-6-yl-methyl-4-(beta-D-ribofuranosyl)aminobenzene 5'-phosphate synthase